MDSSISSTPAQPLLERADEFARRDPTKAVAAAFSFGFLFHLLPLGALVAMLTSLVLALARPALLFLGVWKAFDLIRSNTSAPSQHE